ncbi:glycosyl hydrolase [candidate division KSB1 bacterium]|nr:glycosyl hydrolase [candidate division KSB1 bacterium]
MKKGFTIFWLFALVALVLASPQKDDKKGEKDPGEISSKTFSGLKWRSIGPALTSGRIGDIAVHPQNKSIYFAAVSSGGVWKTENSGTTWKSVFDKQGSYSIGCVTIDQNDPLVVWVGSGENNSQRSVSYGDGVYKSVDGGKSWKNMGLKDSQHIGKIVVDPRNSNTVFVAAQGPLWNAGGDRGLYKTIDGGKTWKKVLDISENTGVTDLVYDPRNPDVMYAASYQRRRRVWTLIDGGPESAIYKSEDGGESWNKLSKGLPKGDVGRIGLAISPADPNVLYAIIEASGKSGGFFRSNDRGANWKKQSSYVSGSPQYYQEIVCDPKEVNRVYSLDTYNMVTDDGGKNFRRLGEKSKHVDNHAMWIDPDNTDYLLVGCDGGIYESFDRGANWHFKANLPVTQFYRVTVDNDFPFYNVYGGTQDNYSLGGPSQTTNVHGITNGDWFVTRGGDGFETQIDPKDPNIIYSQSQYGGLVRFDKRSGERINIVPQPGKGEPALRWNWNSPLLISPHLNTRVYFASNVLYRTDDRGNSWRAVSPDLSRQIDRNQLTIMGKVQRSGAVAKNTSTSHYGSIVSLSESTIQEGLIYAGTDDGLIQVTEDGGQNWRKIDKFPGIPEMIYVSDIEASLHDVNTVYASFDNHKIGDFKPYILVSNNKGKSWRSISSNLPERGSVHTIAEDHVKSNLLFVGTEFSVYVTVNGGGDWHQLKSGLPPIAVRDLDIQRRENDLIAGTFGRGFYILDNYQPLRDITPDLLKQNATLFPVKDPWMYMQDSPLGGRGKSFQGESYYTASNPPFGAIFTYYLKEGLKTQKQKRQDMEKKTEKDGGAPPYPTRDQFRQERREEKPTIILTVRDQDGNIVRRITGATGSGIHRVAWDLRYPAANPTSLGSGESRGFGRRASGPMGLPGTYEVALSKMVDGEETPLGTPQSFITKSLGTATLAAADKKELLAFQKKTARLQRAVLGAGRAAREAQTRINHLKKAFMDTPGADLKLGKDIRTLENRLKDLLLDLSGDPVNRDLQVPSPPSINNRVQGIVRTQWSSSSAPTQTSQDAYNIAAEEFTIFLGALRTLIEVDLKNIEQNLEDAGAPWTPGRIPRWTIE